VIGRRVAIDGERFSNGKITQNLGVEEIIRTNNFSLLGFRTFYKSFTSKKPLLSTKT